MACCWLLRCLLTVFFSIYCRPLLLAFGASENTISFAVSYMQIYTLGTLFVQLSLGMNAFITAQGFAKTSMFTIFNWRGCKYCIRSYIYICIPYGGSGSCVCNHYFPSNFGSLGCLFFKWKQNHSPIKKSKFFTKMENSRTLSFVRSFAVCNECNREHFVCMF